ncbi:AP2 domain class transcription factor [Medicago truncatula]|uniref:AP2 domain class transcription factor n=1 Tax=Medicago truncatula TaxID=3880 RepID=G7I659_MEDTR|nr:AP2 domain class transcription factor [Medicago truncatula]
MMKKESKKLRSRRKGGPENALCNYKGVRQRTWGKWVAEIREPKPLAYDNASKRLYGESARLNLAPSQSSTTTSIGIDPTQSTAPKCIEENSNNNNNNKGVLVETNLDLELQSLPWNTSDFVMDDFMELNDTLLAQGLKDWDPSSLLEI